MSSVEFVPEPIKSIHDKYVNETLANLEILCKKFIKEGKLDSAWTIIHLIDESNK